MKITNKAIKFTVDTVDELLTITGEENQVIVVSDENRGGTFIYRSAKSVVNDGGVTFNGWCRQYSGAVFLEWFGANSNLEDNSAVINSAISSSNSIDTNIVDTLYIKNRIIVNKSNMSIRFSNIVNIKPTTNIICLQIGDINGTQLSNVHISNLNISSDGYGQADAGLINLNNVKDSEISDINIIVDNDNAKLLNAHFNGVSTSNNTENVILRNIHTNGTPKSGFHISTKSRRMKIYDCSSQNTGNYNPNVYGYSPGLDIQANDSIVSNFYSYNTAGYGITIQAARFVDSDSVVWDDTCYNTIFENIIIKNAQKSGLGTTSFQTGLYPENVVCKNVNIDNSKEHGIIISTGKNLAFYNTYIKNSTLSGVYQSSNIEYIHTTFNNTTIHNFNSVNTAYNWGVAIGRTDRIYFIDTKFIHDAPTTNTKAFAGINGKVISYVYVDNFNMEGFNSPWYWVGTPVNAILTYSGLGAPINDYAKSGSKYTRLDGGQATTFYINAGGVWYPK